MKKIWKAIVNLFKNLFCKKQVTEKPKPSMLGTIHQNNYEFDDELIIKTLESWENINTFKEYCNKNGITTNRNDVHSNSTYHDQTEYNLKFIASDLKSKLEFQGEEKYHKLRLSRIKEWKEMREREDREKLEQWEKEGRLCPKCKKSYTENKNTGVVVIYYDYYAGGPIGAGINVSGSGHKEFQFHYKKCHDCDYWEMTEYRETPSWWDDLWDLDCPFKQGNIIDVYKSGKHGTDKYTSHKITSW